MRYLALIPARGGSKGIPKKNIVDCAGKPLIAWTIEAAHGSVGPAQTYVSTDDAEIAQVARELGANVIMRSPELAGDNSPTEDAVVEALQSIQAENVVLLQPTSPLRTWRYIRQAITQFEEGEFDSLLSIHPVDGHCLWTRCPAGEWEPLYIPAHRPMRQSAPEYAVENGAIYISRAWCYLKHGCRLAGRVGHYVMPPSVDVDGPADLQRAAIELKRTWRTYSWAK